MAQTDELMALLLQVVTDGLQKENKDISVGVSNRHVHLSQKDLETLFGVGYRLSAMKNLSQPGQYACKETVTLCGPKGAIEKVRILAPVRKETQVEILRGDCFKLGVKAPVRQSGDLDKTPGITLVGPQGTVCLTQGLIVALRHIHMHTDDALCFGVCDGQVVRVRVQGERGGLFENVLVRSNANSALECHLDTEEANAMDLSGSATVKIEE